MSEEKNGMSPDMAVPISVPLNALKLVVFKREKIDKFPL